MGHHRPPQATRSTEQAGSRKLPQRLGRAFADPGRCCRSQRTEQFGTPAVPRTELTPRLGDRLCDGAAYGSVRHRPGQQQAARTRRGQRVTTAHRAVCVCSVSPLGHKSTGSRQCRTYWAPTLWAPCRGSWVVPPTLAGSPPDRRRTTPAAGRLREVTSQPILDSLLLEIDAVVQPAVALAGTDKRPAPPRDRQGPRRSAR